MPCLLQIKLNKKMEKLKLLYIEGVGYCKEVTINRYNSDGVNEPYNIYELIIEKLEKL